MHILTDTSGESFIAADVDRFLVGVDDGKCEDGVLQLSIGVLQLCIVLLLLSGTQLLLMSIMASILSNISCSTEHNSSSSFLLLNSIFWQFRHKKVVGSFKYSWYLAKQLLLPCLHKCFNKSCASALQAAPFKSSRLFLSKYSYNNNKIFQTRVTSQNAN